MIALYAFNRNVTQKWPIEDYSTRWFTVAFEDEAVREALLYSLLAALGATAIALVLGTLASLAVARYRFFGREVITFAVILPIALPGIVTGLALQATILDVLGPLGVSFGLSTIIVGHATFCVVVVYNNVHRPHAANGRVARRGVGRPRRRQLADVPVRHVPADAHGAPRRRRCSRSRSRSTRSSSPIFTSGAQQTLPIWIFATLARPAELPIVNVVALFVIVASIIPVYFAQQLAGAGGRDQRRPRAARSRRPPA